MRIRLAVPEEHVEPGVINAALEAVTRLDEHMIRSGQSPTSRELVQAGARWHPEPPGDEHFDHGGTIAARGHGDCDDWAPLHAATMRASGEDPGAKAVVIPSGPGTWHAVVKKGSGEVLTGDKDISVMAGMPPPRHSVIGGADVMQVYAEDPHDGRIYQGSLAPTTGPLSIHCGPQVRVRGIEVVGHGLLYQGRCDMPICGSPLFGVQRRRRGRVIGAQVPYAFSCTSTADAPHEALYHAITGAVLCGDAAEVLPNLDRYKLLAMQMGMSGHPPEAVRDAITEMIAHDLEQAETHTGIPGHAHVEQLKGQLAAHGVHVAGTDLYGASVGGFFSDIGKIANGIVHVVAPIINDVAKVAKSPIWGDIIHGIQAAVSVVPGLGTAVSEIIATAETAINAVEAFASGNPLLFAIHAAENYALASIPGASAIRIIIDPYVGKILDMAKQKALVDSGVVDKILNSVPDKPKIGPISPKSIVASLVHLLVGHLGMRNTSGKVLAKPAPILATMHPPAAASPVHAAVKPAGVPHAAVHVDAPKVAPSPVHAAAASHAPLLARPAPPTTHVVTTPTGAFHWHCGPMQGGGWRCDWIVQGVAPPAAPTVRQGPGMTPAQRAAANAAFKAQIRAKMKPSAPTAPGAAPSSPTEPRPGTPGAPGPTPGTPGAPTAAAATMPPGGGGGGSPSDGGGGGGGSPSYDPGPAYDPGPSYDPGSDPNGDDQGDQASP